jgi:hypothetical protein
MPVRLQLPVSAGRAAETSGQAWRKGDSRPGTSVPVPHQGADRTCFVVLDRACDPRIGGADGTDIREHDRASVSVRRERPGQAPGAGPGTDLAPGQRLCTARLGGNNTRLMPGCCLYRESERSRRDQAGRQDERSAPH